MNKSALLILKSYKRNLTKQQYKTIKGQILAGDAAGALKGLNKLQRKKSQPQAG